MKNDYQNYSVAFKAKKFTSSEVFKKINCYCKYNQYIKIIDFLHISTIIIIKRYEY
jgi:hypothetical protein